MDEFFKVELYAFAVLTLLVQKVLFRRNLLGGQLSRQFSPSCTRYIGH